ncbi:sulfite exporter TauE/SafE family protein [Joostella atrarenae]|uniref:Probable membrane transporter protein n=1 Tax=Joostella atrarenae TaxID=679257 RepID=A0ABS9J1E9_9FLAO|nr:sulfite exporter TauE/SafE family protein [Joostella atrarenae]MCF8714193.1 sulfite exporter TauE/SafE family protein [Joostella atrarenae]
METAIIITIILILISFTISMFGSVVGFGGGIFMVPILITVFHFPLTTAVGSVMISLIPSSLISTYLNRKEGYVDFKMGILLEIPTILGVVIGSLLLSYISAERLEVLFAVLVLFLGISFFLKKGKKDKKGNGGFFYRLNKYKPRYIIKNKRNHVAYRFSAWMVLFFGLLAGTLAGLFGIGGGFLKTPIMLKVFKMPAKIATATALFMIVITSTTGTFSHFMLGHIELDKAWPIMLGFAAGALGGQRLNLKMKNKTLEKLIGMGLVLAALVMMSNFIIK